MVKKFFFSAQSSAEAPYYIICTKNNMILVLNYFDFITYDTQNQNNKIYELYSNLCMISNIRKQIDNIC